MRLGVVVVRGLGVVDVRGLDVMDVRVLDVGMCGGEGVRCSG